MRTNKLLSFAWTLVTMILIASCGEPEPTAEELRLAKEKAAAAVAAEKLEQEIRQAEQARADTALVLDLTEATDAELKVVLAECRQAILDAARGQSNIGVEPFLVDEYVSDTYQSAAFGNSAVMEGDEERIKGLREEIAKGVSDTEVIYLGLNLSYMAIITRDSFDGLKKEGKKFTCKIEPGLEIGRLR